MRSLPNRLSRRPFSVYWNVILVRKGGFEPPRLSAPPPQDGVSASSTTSAGIKLVAINNLTTPVSEGISDCTGFCTDLWHSTRASGRGRFPSRANNFSTPSLASVHVPHGRSNVIVPADVLQCKRVGILAGLGHKRVPRCVQARVRMR